MGRPKASLAPAGAWTARALLLWALDDKSGAQEFRHSLFGETRQGVSRLSARTVVG